MLKREYLSGILSLILMVCFSSTIYAQDNGSNGSIRPRSVGTRAATSSKNDRQYRFTISWEGKRLGILGGVNNKKKNNSVTGVTVKEVIPGTAADRAGLEVGDLIIDVNGQAITSRKTLRSAILSLNYDQEYALTVMRNKNQQVINFTLKEIDDDDAYYDFYDTRATEALTKLQGNLQKSIDGAKPVRTPKKGFATQRVRNKIGLKVQELTQQLTQYFGVNDGGVLVSVSVSGKPAAEGGVKAGDCIIAVNGVTTASADSFHTEVSKVKEGQLNFTVIRNHQQIELQVIVPPTN